MRDDTGRSYADRVLDEAMAATTGGVDPERAQEVVADTLKALAKMTAALKAAEYEPADFERISRAASHLMKMADGLVRLVEFASGRADSRPDKGGEWLRALTDDQLATVMGWFGAAEGRPHGGSR